MNFCKIFDEHFFYLGSDSSFYDIRYTLYDKIYIYLWNVYILYIFVKCICFIYICEMYIFYVYISEIYMFHIYLWNIYCFIYIYEICIFSYIFMKYMFHIYLWNIYIYILFIFEQKRQTIAVLLYATSTINNFVSCVIIFLHLINIFFLNLKKKS